MTDNRKQEPWIVEAESTKDATDDAPAHSPVFRHYTSKDGFPEVQEGKTLHEVFQSSVKRFPDSPLLGHRPTGEDGNAKPFTFDSYAESAGKVKKMAGFLRHVGMQKGSRCGIFGINTPQWMITMQACVQQGMEVVPVYDTLGAEAVQFIIDHSESSTVVAQDSKLASLAHVLPKCPKVHTVIYWGNPSKEDLNKEAFRGITVMSFDEALSKGNENPSSPNPPDEKDIAVLMYTSGTTGEPKGVELTHKSILACIASAEKYLEENNLALGPNDVFLSYLPLAHILDMIVEVAFIHLGGAIGYWRGSIKLILDDLASLQPTIFAGVPRVFDRIYSEGKKKIDGSWAIKKIFDVFYKRKLKRLNEGVPHEKAAPLGDLLVFNKMRNKLGGRVRAILSGAAPLTRPVEDFLNVCMCCPAVQGYGLTETNAASFISIPDDPDSKGTVGPPLPCTEMKLESVPELGYDALTKPYRGELCMRGPSLFSGYHKRKETTEEAMDKQGFFHTGDVAELSEKGFLRIIDRMKNIFKLSQGEYVAVEKVESAYSNCEICETMWVYGDSTKPHLIAVLVPTEKRLKAIAKENNINHASFEDLCAKDEARRIALREIDEAGRENGLKGFELVKNLHLEPSAFSVDSGLLTPTYKKKRPQLKSYYEQVIEDLYANK